LCCGSRRSAPARPRSLDDLPPNAVRYLRRLEALRGVPVDIVSTGADRARTIVLRHPFD
jgi:adenylosuccinate synthase